MSQIYSPNEIAAQTKYSTNTFIMHIVIRAVVNKRYLKKNNN